MKKMLMTLALMPFMALAVTVGDAVDAPQMTFTTGGSANWLGQTSVSHDGEDAAKSGTISDSQSTWMQTTFTGEKDVSFWWKVSSESNYDYLRVYVDGTVQGAISGETGWVQKSIHVTGTGTHTLTWVYSKDGSRSSGSDCGWVDELSFIEPIAEALDALQMTFTTGGSANWFGQTSVSHDGEDATKSGTISNSQSTWMQTMFTGEKDVSFWWKVSSESNYDYLRVYVDGTEQGAISGETGWVQKSIHVTGAGTHTLKWVYSKDISVARGSDCGWVDQLSVVSPIAKALDAPQMTFTTGGSANWFGQTYVSHDCEDAAQSETISNSQSTWMQTTFTGEKDVSFWWKVSSERNWDYLRVYVDGTEQGAISGETGWVQKSIHVTGTGTHTLKWVYSKDGSCSSGSDCGWVDELSLVEPIAKVLDAPQMTFTTGGSANWFGQPYVSHDGEDAAQSGAISDGQSTWMQTTFTGEKDVSFCWKVSSESNYDYLRVYVDGTEQGAISGETGWVKKSFHVSGAGTHTLKWVYSKDGSVTEGNDCGWVDQLSVDPSIAEALNAPQTTFTTGGSANWLGKTSVSHDGEHAAQSGAISDGQSTSMQTTFTGEKDVSFWWKVSSESGYDYLRVYVDGTEQGAISGETDWEQKSIHVTGAGTHTLTWTYSKDGSYSNGSDCGWVDQLSINPSIAEALDALQMTFTTGGSANWLGQTSVSHDGEDAAQSGTISNSQSTWMQTTFTGEKDVSFCWKVSSESNYDYLRVYVDGTEQGAISGETDWVQKSIHITGAGTHTLTWTYSKDGSYSRGSDCGWVDQLSITGSGDPRMLYVNGTTGSDTNSGMSPTSAKKTIQAAIDVSVDGGTIFVAPGTYAPIATANKRIDIVSLEGRDVTIIDGQCARRCADLGSVRGDTNTVLRGFSIVRGHTSAQFGAGVRCGQLQDCYVGGCTNSFGIWNSEGGGAWGAYAVDCEFRQNNATHGGGMANGWATRCIVRDNYAHDDGGGIHGVEARDCLLASNSSGNWGGGSSGAASAGGPLYNVTIVGNRANGGGGIIVGKKDLYNCIVFGNTVSSGSIVIDATLHNCFTADPHFVDAANGNYRLAADSPCVDAGNNDYVMGDKDLAGNVRIWDDIVDIGCYEYDSPTPPVWTVSFDARGGIASQDTMVLTNNAAIGELPTATWDWHVFLGWFTAAEGGEEVTAETVITADATYYAHWQQVDREFVFSAIDYLGTYDGTDHGIAVTVTDPASGAVVTYSSTVDGEYTTTPITFTNVTDGSQNVYFRIAADGYETFSGVATVMITPKALTEGMVGSIGSQIYAGSPVEPSVTVSDTWPCMITPNDYTITYTDNTSEGTGFAHVTGQGNYTGTIDRSFEIFYAPVDLREKIQATWVYDDDFVYDGTEKSVRLAGLPDDVTVTYEGASATNAGYYTARASVSYAQWKYYCPPIDDLTWRIAPRPVTITSGSATKPYDGTPLTSPDVAIGGSGWVAGEGAHYDVAGSQTAVGESANTFMYMLQEGTKAANYEITQVEGTLTVAPALDGWTYVETVDGVEWTFTVANGEAQVDWASENAGAMVIPAKLGGRPVTGVANYAFYRCSSVTSVTMPESVMNIGSGTFYGCSELKNVTIPECVTNLGMGAFYECSNLTSVTIPEGMTSIGDYMFYGCSSVTNVTLPSSVTSIGTYAFFGCSALTSVTIPEGVTSIRERAFSHCGLTHAEIPSSVTDVGYCLFYECSGLMSVKIPEGVTRIGDYAFYNCVSLSDVTIPSSMTSIGAYAFYGCSKLGSGVVIVDDCVLTVNGTYYISQGLPSGVRLIAGGAFYGCGAMTDITMPESVMGIGPDAFYGCGKLVLVIHQGNAPEVGEGAFDGVANGCVLMAYDGTTGWNDDDDWKWQGLTLVYRLRDASAVGDPGATNVLWRTSGDAPWVTRNTREGWVVRSGAIGKNSETWVECVVTNGCRVAFDWTTSCEEGEDGEMFDFLSFSVDGDEMSAICGEMGSWTNEVFEVFGEGEHVLRWTYQKDRRTDKGNDCGWIREVRVDPEVSVTFDANGATLGEVPEVSTVYFGDTIDVPDQGTLVRSCHTFGGWQYDEATYQEGDELLLETNAVAFVAVWDAKVLDAPMLVTPEEPHVFSEKILVTLQAPANAQGIRYTLDGTEPTAASAVYVGPFEIEDMAKTVKAVAFADDWFDSACSTWKLSRAPWTAAECLNAESYDFSFGGDADWVRDLDETHDGEAAMRSGVIGRKQESSIRMIATGAGTVSFWCKVSSEYDLFDGEAYDGLAISVDGKDVYDYLIGGEIGWTNITVAVSGAGEHVISWRYVKDRTGDAGEDCAWLDCVTWTPSGPRLADDPDAVVTGDAESGYTITPSGVKKSVEVMIPVGIPPNKVIIVVGTDVETVKPNGATVKIVKGGNDITGYLNIPKADASGMVDLSKAAVKEAVVKEALDPDKGAEIVMNAESPSLTTSETKPGLTYTLHEGTTLQGMNPGDSKLGDGKAWTPNITIKGGSSGFYSIGVTK